MNTVYAIGDIHGCFDALKLLFEKNDYSPDDQFVFLGDYVDRGPDVAGTIDYLIKLQSQRNCVFLKGNHEIMMKNASLHARSFDFWHRNGGKQTLQSYRLDGSTDWANRLPRQHWDFLDSALPYHEVGSLKFVHASLAPGVPLAEQASENLYWKKIDQYTSAYSAVDQVICGHTAQVTGEILNLYHTICIDTCAYGDQWLTMLDCKGGDFLQASQAGKIQRGSIDISLPNT